MSRKSTQIALGGVFSALCLVLLFMTGLIPFATYALPMVSGAMLIPIVSENGTKTAVMIYISVSLLSVFVVPDKEAAMMFIAFFGYYPIIKSKLERIPGRALEYLCKLAIFNVSIVTGFVLLIYVLGMPDLVSDMGDFGRYSAVILLGMGNVLFVAYDFALTQYFTLYVKWFKPKFLRR